MDMMEFLRTRRTYRRFEQRPVAPEILQECVDAARHRQLRRQPPDGEVYHRAKPRSCGRRAAAGTLGRLSAPGAGTPKANEVPTAFIAVLQDENLPGANDMDAGLALGSLTAAAWAHGVGSCIMGAIDRPALTKLLALPEKMRLCCMVALGYPTHKSHLVEMQNGSVKYYLDEAGDYCVPKRPLSKVLLKTL